MMPYFRRTPVRRDPAKANVATDPRSVTALLALPNSDLIAGVVLAAGRSSRMGAPKALLTYHGETFLGRIVGAFLKGGCDPVVVVVGPPEERDSTRIAAEALRLGARVAVNPVIGSQQIDSLRVALNHVPAGAEGILATPVDSPGATAEVVAALIEAGRRGAPIAIAAYEGRRGHPTLFGRDLFPELMTDDLEAGARTLIGRYLDSLVQIDVQQPEVLLDIDTPAEYRRLKGETG
jgi:molybdenum cofactor cytidylyltransferase